MIKLGICNELFEGWEFGRVCQTVKEIGYDGLEIAPVHSGAPDRRPEHGASAGAEGHRRGRGPRDDRPALAAGQDGGFYLTSPDPAVRRATGDYLAVAGRGDARPRRLAHGAGLAQAARPAAGRNL